MRSKYARYILPLDPALCREKYLNIHQLQAQNSAVSKYCICRIKILILASSVLEYYAVAVDCKDSIVGEYLAAI